MTSRWLRRSLVAASAVLVGLGVLGFLAFRYDEARADQLLPGVVVDGVPAGGMTSAEVLRRLDADLPALRAGTIRVTAGGEEARLTLGRMGLRSDAAEVLRRARADADRLGMARRVWHRLLDKPVDRAYEVRLTVDPGTVRTAVGGLAERVELAPVDARIDTAGDMVTVLPASDGRSLDVATTAERVHRLALERANGAPAAGDDVVEAPLVVTKPAVTGFADVILVRTAENKLYHFEDGNLVKTYTVATGTRRYPTPKGTFTISEKRRNPTWVNPDPKGWGASLPARIGPGPRNPLGTRALNLTAPGIRIHGTRNVASLGTAASHGCIRMSIADSEELFELVEKGTPVVIIQGPPPPEPVVDPAAAVSTFADPNAPVDLEAG